MNEEDVEAKLKKRLVMETAGWILDVRGLKMPLPMVLTLKVLEELPPGMSLVQINERIPQFLFPILDQRGFSYAVENSDGTVRITLRRK